MRDTSAYSLRSTSVGLTRIALRGKHADERRDCNEQHANGAEHERIDRLDPEQQVPHHAGHCDRGEESSGDTER